MFRNFKEIKTHWELVGSKPFQPHIADTFREHSVTMGAEGLKKQWGGGGITKFHFPFFGGGVTKFPAPVIYFNSGE